MAQILLVDDEKIARALYSDFLAGAGHEVTAVGSIAEARAALEQGRFDLLVTDLILPQGDGLELLQHARVTQPDVQVIVITALDKVEPAVRAIKSGATDYLVKPIQPEVLAHAVNRALTQHTLLKQNEALRRHVALLEAGQRIATTLDRERLSEVVAADFRSHCGARAVAVFSRDNGAQSLVGADGFGDRPPDELKALLEGPVSEAVSTADRRGQDFQLEALGAGPALLVPVYEGDTLYGAALLLTAEPIGEDNRASAVFLARHLGLALKNLGKFAAVEDLVYLDDLTHLFNSRYLELVLEKEFKNAAKGDKPFALLFLDLDYFKSVNDTHGHLVGSKLLVEVARVLKGCVRDNDIICRWGGDEYVALLRGTDSGGALKVAERIRRAIESHRFLAREGFGLTLTTCIGIAAYPEHGLDKQTILDLSDRAMYRGKKGTRNVIYMASKNLEATPASRQQPYTPPPDKAK